VQFEWDPNKAASNLQKHGVRFAEAVTVFEDNALLTMPNDENEKAIQFQQSPTRSGRASNSGKGENHH
jgi:uncharacterized DUF497 family protein